MKILLTGVHGQLGAELRSQIGPEVELVALDRSGFNLADPDQIRSVIREVQPTVILNPAAYTAVDKAETDRDTAYAVNATAPAILAEEARALDIVLIHFSTDYVFDGTLDRPYRESDTTNPRSVYGASKRAGEVAILASGARHLILRTSWVVGPHGGNFAKTMLRLAGERDTLRVVADQHGVPTSTRLLSDVTRAFLRRDRDQLESGIYHVAPSGTTSWFDYARFVIREAETAGRSLRCKADQVSAITTAEYPLPAPRPANSRLSTDKLSAALGLILPPWQDGVSDVLQQLFKEPTHA